MRTYELKRVTNETDIWIKLNLDGEGKSDIKTGCGFLDHMLTLFSCHGDFDLTIDAKGDTFVDYHHTVEDIGISLGLSFKEALSDKKGIKRYGSMILPMDEALILSAVDLSGRSYLNFDAEMPSEKVGDFDTELVKEFFLGFCRNAEATLHIKELSGENTHHIIEGIYKSVARSLKEAVAIDEAKKDKIPSSKGVL